MRTSGPITIEVKEGMVTVARHVYEDTRTALTDDWPKWVEETLELIESREHLTANTGKRSD